MISIILIGDKLATYLTNFAADATVTTPNTYGTTQFAVNYWTAVPEYPKFFYYKVKNTNTKTCTITVKILGPQLFASQSGATCSTAYDGTTWYTSTCTCSAAAGAYCNFMGQFTGVEPKGYSVSYYYPSAMC
jgi:hypothetical protein